MIYRHVHMQIVKDLVEFVKAGWVYLVESSSKI